MSSVGQQQGLQLKAGFGKVWPRSLGMNARKLCSHSAVPSLAALPILYVVVWLSGWLNMGSNTLLLCYVNWLRDSGQLGELGHTEYLLLLRESLSMLSWLAQTSKGTPGCLQTHSSPPASVSEAVGLQEYAIISGFYFTFSVCFISFYS